MRGYSLHIFCGSCQAQLNMVFSSSENPCSSILLRFCHVSSCFRQQASPSGVIADQFDSFIGSISNASTKPFFQAGDDSCRSRLRDTEFPFQLLRRCCFCSAFGSVRTNLHHSQVFASQGVVRLLSSRSLQLNLINCPLGIIFAENCLLLNLQ